MPTDNSATDQFVGEIRIFAGNTQPEGWAFCDGRSLGIGDYPMLFGVIGTTFGGDGINNFEIPDLRGRLPLGEGAGKGLSSRSMGQQLGAEVVALTEGQLPLHSHSIQATNANGNSSSPGGNMMAASAGNDLIYRTTGSAIVTMGATTGAAGAGLPLSTLQPALVLNFMIALIGRDPQPPLIRISVTSESSPS